MTGATPRLLVLGWHNVQPTWRYPRADVTGFARQLKALRRICTVVPFEEALDAMAEGRALPPRAVALTFDDGYRDNLTHAVPVLADLAMPATVFLVPGFLDRTVQAWWERLGWAFTRTRRRAVVFGGRRLELDGAARRHAALTAVETALKGLPEQARTEAVDDLVDDLEPDGIHEQESLFLDWDGADGLVRAGIAIGSHTATHAILSAESPAAVQADLTRTRSVLRERLGTTVDSIAYPNGQIADYNASVVAAARDAGHRYGLTAHGLVNDRATPPFEIRRRLISPELSPARLVAGMARHYAKA